LSTHRFRCLSRTATSIGRVENTDHHSKDYYHTGYSTDYTMDYSMDYAVAYPIILGKKIYGLTTGFISGQEHGKFC